MSNSVELAPSMPATWRANSATATCIPMQMPRKGTLLLAGELGGEHLSLDTPPAEAAGDEHAVGAGELLLRGGGASPALQVSESIQSISTRLSCSEAASRSASETER